MDIYLLCIAEYNIDAAYISSYLKSISAWLFVQQWDPFTNGQ